MACTPASEKGEENVRKAAFIAVFGLGIWLFSGPGFTVAQQQDAAPAFSEVSSIFGKYHCTLCHGTAKASDGLALDTFEALMKGGKNGPVVIPKDPAKSRLVQRIKGQKEPRMPINGPPWVTDAEMQTIEKWIAAGASKS
jgi:cytochrome c551/c552